MATPRTDGLTPSQRERPALPSEIFIWSGLDTAPIDAMQLAVKGSLFVTRPALADYIADPAERGALAGELFDHVASRRITVPINQRYALEDAVRAHQDLESGRSVGSSVFALDSL